MIWLFFVIALAVALIACGSYMLYSAITGRGIPKPEDNALLQTRVQYKLRGVIGVAFVILGVMIFIGIIQAF